MRSNARAVDWLGRDDDWHPGKDNRFKKSIVSVYV